MTRLTPRRSVDPTVPTQSATIALRLPSTPDSRRGLSAIAATSASGGAKKGVIAAAR